jgi:hypothetical protein
MRHIDVRHVGLDQQNKAHRAMAPRSWSSAHAKIRFLPPKEPLPLKVQKSGTRDKFNDFEKIYSPKLGPKLSPKSWQKSA